jgi:hypothetical protein
VRSETKKAGNGRLIVQLPKEAWYNIIVVQLRSSTWLMTSNSLELECNVTIMAILGIERKMRNSSNRETTSFLRHEATQRGRMISKMQIKNKITFSDPRSIFL